MLLAEGLGAGHGAASTFRTDKPLQRSGPPSEKESRNARSFRNRMHFQEIQVILPPLVSAAPLNMEDVYLSIRGRRRTPAAGRETNKLFPFFLRCELFT